MIMNMASSNSAKVGPKNSLARKHSMPASVAQTARPSKKMLYRARHPIMVRAFRDNHQAAVTIPPGDTLELIGPAQDDRFVIVSIKGEEFLVSNPI
jgi:hypothetical protein